MTNNNSNKESTNSTKSTLLQHEEEYADALLAAIGNIKLPNFNNPNGLNNNKEVKLFTSTNSPEIVLDSPKFYSKNLEEIKLKESTKEKVEKKNSIPNKNIIKPPFALQNKIPNRSINKHKNNSFKHQNNIKTEPKENSSLTNNKVSKSSIDSKNLEDSKASKEKSPNLECTTKKASITFNQVQTKNNFSLEPKEKTTKKLNKKAQASDAKPLVPSLSKVNNAKAKEHKSEKTNLAEIAKVAKEEQDKNSKDLTQAINFDAVRQSFHDERIQRKANIRSYRRSPTLFIIKQIIKPITLVNPFLSVLLGACLSLPVLPASWDITVLIASLVTVFFVQVFANLCREYSYEELATRYECSLVDHKFTSRKNIFYYTIIAFIFTCISGGSLIYLAHLSLGTSLVFVGLGGMTLLILLRYSVGENPYSFSILGELSYLFVYGLLIVGASFYLQVHRYENIILAPAIACGLCSVASLNLINMRDSYVDSLYNKDNLAVFLGPKAGRILQTLIYFTAIILYSYFTYILQFPIYSYAFLISIPFILVHLIIIHNEVKSSTLNIQKYLTTIINILMTGGFTLTTYIYLGFYF